MTDRRQFAEGGRRSRRGSHHPQGSAKTDADSPGIKIGANSVPPVKTTSGT